MGDPNESVQLKRGIKRGIITLILSKLKQLDGDRFERVLKELFSEMDDWDRVEIVQAKDNGKQGAGDDGIDLRLEKLGPLRETEREAAIQAKCYTTNNVSIGTFRDFGFACSDFDKGYLITTSDFTGPAKESAKEEDDIFLINGRELVELFGERIGYNCFDRHVSTGPVEGMHYDMLRRIRSDTVNLVTLFDENMADHRQMESLASLIEDDIVTPTEHKLKLTGSLEPRLIAEGLMPIDAWEYVDEGEEEAEVTGKVRKIPSSPHYSLNEITNETSKGKGDDVKGYLELATSDSFEESWGKPIEKEIISQSRINISGEKEDARDVLSEQPSYARLFHTANITV